ncbi:PAS domain-containing sensor histidine kinase [Neorhizobium alkalisoli]|uniref:histidine kinase n=1 Tax=Neorhizobium alkalisoli TaxID=528178 RepID=A0A561R6P1_9HYPH|nr:PAS domain-containing sensor histidine kinase [Neorhizobium alkalisoli]TWF58272.1 PAS domain S-box-containing protein [Neorhizobium alkalisoli]
MTTEFAPELQASASGASPLLSRHRLRMTAAIALGSSIFLIDTLTALGSAVAVLYAMVIVLAADLGGRSTILRTSALCAALTLISFLYVHGPSAESQVVLRLIFSLAANGLTTALLLKRSSDQLVLEAQARLLELTSDAVFLRDESGRIIYWNNGAEALYGWTAREAIGRQADEIIHMVSSPSRAEVQHLLEAGGTWDGEAKIFAKDGRQIDVLSRWRMDSGRDGSRRVIETTVDISRRKAAERDLKASEHRYRTIFETLAVAIWEHDLREVKQALVALRDSGVRNLRAYLAEHPEFVTRTRAMVHITDVNATALKLMGVPSKAEFFTRLDGFLPETDSTFSDFLIALDEGHPTYQAETSIRDKQGRLIPIIVAMSFPPGGEGLDRIQVSIIDITERLEFQKAKESFRQELEQASRAAMVGEISASIAHEVNQPLSATMTFVQAAQRWLARDVPDLGEAKAALQHATSSIEQAANVIKRVRMLLGKAKSDTGAVAIDAAIMDAVRLKQSDLTDSNVDLMLRLNATTGIITGDRTLLLQTFLNVIANAAQAMEATAPQSRSLVIQTEILDDILAVRFLDTGPGLDQPGDNLFKPFHTTKPTGMGLGLAMCRSIVTAHDGTISIGNRDDMPGAIVEIRLPGVTRH